MDPMSEEEMLRQILAQHEQLRDKEFAEAAKHQAAGHREQAICISVEGLIDALKTKSAGPTPTGGKPHVVLALRQPPLIRNLHFAGKSVIAACEKIMAVSEKPVHVHDLTKDIYVTSDSDFVRAKNIVSGELIRGVSEGRFVRTAESLYRLATEEERKQREKERLEAKNTKAEP
jgi:hypothetical protein